MGAQGIRGYSVPTGVSSTYTGPIPGAYAASPLSQIAGLGSIIGGVSNTPFGTAVGDWISNTLKNLPGSGWPTGGTGEVTIGDPGLGGYQEPPT
jgi:hypothetical protein